MIQLGLSRTRGAHVKPRSVAKQTTFRNRRGGSGIGNNGQYWVFRERWGLDRWHRYRESCELILTKRLATHYTRPFAAIRDMNAS